MSYHKKRLVTFLLLLLSFSKNIPENVKPTRTKDYLQTGTHETNDVTRTTTKDDFSLTSPRAFRLVKTLVVLNAITATSLSYAFPDAFNMNKQHWIQK